MRIHFLKFLTRTFWRQRFYASINLLGLVLGLTVSIIIYLYVQREFSVDENITVSPNTFRLLRKGDLNNSPYLIGVTSGPFAEALPIDFPQDVDKTLRLMTNERWARFEDKIFYEKNFSFADSNFFNVFNFQLDKGNREKALTNPNGVVITNTIARKYFGDEDPINKIIQVDDRYDLIVTGVLADQSLPSHLRIDFLGNIAIFRDRPWFSQWWSNAMITYVVLNEGSDFKNLNGQLPQFMDKYFGKDFTANKNRIDLLLQPIEEVYFEHNVRYDLLPHGNITSIYIFSGIGIFILIIALINFVNLATAKSMTRAREVGIKKTMGSTKGQLVFQFLVESAIFSIVALSISLMIVEILLPSFNGFFSLDLTLELTGGLITKIIIFLCVISLSAGIYPAFVMSSFSAISVLKGKVRSGPGAARFRKILVSVQFTISTFLLVGTFLVGEQLDFINSKALGYDKDAIILIEGNNNEIYNQRETFKDLLLTNSSISSVCTMGGEPGGFHDTMSMLVEGMEINPRMRTNFVDEDFAKTFSLTFVAGRNFSKSFSTDLTESLILNETAVKELGFTPEQVLGKRMMIQMVDTTMKNVIGVVKDFHFASLRTPIEPLVLSFSNRTGNFGIKVNSNGLQSSITAIEKVWQQVIPQFPFQFQFLDERLALQYQNEKLQGSLFNLFSIISIVVAALGIIGLATFTSTQRQKEVGVRKVLGASVSSLTFLLMKDFLLLVSLSSLLAWPLAYWSTNEWLSEFAYRISPGFTYYLLATLFIVLISVLSISYQSFKVAFSNPIDVLKEE